MIEGSMTVTDWCNKTEYQMDLAEAAFELALRGLPPIVPSEVFLHMRSLRFDNTEHRARIEREMADAFFLRLKGLVEARIKSLCPKKPNWKTADALLDSITLATTVLPDVHADDLLRLGQFCAIRNCIAHNDGIVDAALHNKIPELKEGTDVCMTKATLGNWFDLCKRLVAAIRATDQ